MTSLIEGRRTSGLVVFFAVALCAPLITLAIRSSSDRGGPSRDTQDPGMVDDPVRRLFDPHEALIPSGSRVSVAAAESRSGREIYLPSSEPLASAELWIDPESSDVAVRFGSDVVVTLEEWEPGQDPAASYEQAVKEWGVGETRVIEGHPAWILPINAQAEGSPPVNVVHIAIAGWDITLFGRGTMDELIETARSLSPTA